MKIGVIYAAADQKSPQVMFRNGLGSWSPSSSLPPLLRYDTNRSPLEDGPKLQPSFNTFVKEMGNVIDLASWKGYRGDMGPTGTTIHDSFKSLDGISLFFA